VSRAYVPGMSGRRIFERVRELGGPAARPEAEAVLRSALGALGAQLTAADRQRLRDTLPESLRSAVDEPLMAAVPTSEALGIAFANACGFAPRYGLEQLEIACRVIAEQAAPELR